MDSVAWIHLSDETAGAFLHVVVNYMLSYSSLVVTMFLVVGTLHPCVYLLVNICTISLDNLCKLQFILVLLHDWVVAVL